MEYLDESRTRRSPFFRLDAHTYAHGAVHTYIHTYRCRKENVDTKFGCGGGGGTDSRKGYVEDVGDSTVWGMMMVGREEYLHTPK